jgi:hypothetical protein
MKINKAVSIFVLNIYKRKRKYREMYCREEKIGGDAETLERREIVISHTSVNYTLRK